VRSVVAMVEGGGGRGCWPCWGREKCRNKREEEKILEGKKKNPYTLLSFSFSKFYFILFFF
jgi:hypothetical protein